jgi:hypothetical protein
VGRRDSEGGPQRQSAILSGLTGGILVRGKHLEAGKPQTAENRFMTAPIDAAGYMDLRASPQKVATRRRWWQAAGMRRPWLSGYRAGMVCGYLTGALFWLVYLGWRLS